MIDVVDPRTDRTEVREDIPDFVRGGRDGVGAMNVGHRLAVCAEKVRLRTPSDRGARHTPNT